MRGMSLNRVSFSTTALTALKKSARAAFPAEACGLLVGRGRRVERLVPLPNAAPNRRAVRFAIDPARYAAAERAAARAKLAVLGVWHSHPLSPAAPSETDAAFIADWPEWVHVIARVDIVDKKPAVGEIRAYRKEGRAIVEIPVGVS